jgi:hypothetical protein
VALMLPGHSRDNMQGRSDGGSTCWLVSTSQMPSQASSRNSSPSCIVSRRTCRPSMDRKVEQTHSTLQLVACSRVAAASRS